MRREVGSITQIAPGVFRISVSVGYSTVTGRRRRPSQIVRGTEREAEIALARLLLSAGKLPENEVSLRQFLEEMYLPHVEKRRRAKTVDGYRSLISHHIVPELGNSALTDLTPYQLSRWLDGLSKVGSDPVEPLSEQSRLHVYRCLFAALRKAMQWGLIADNPLQAVEPPKPGRHQPKDVLTVEESAAYLRAFAGHPLEPLIALALGCGLRRSELAGLLWSSLDFEAGTVTVTRGLHDHKGTVIEEKPKSATSRRTIAVPAWALEILRPLRGIGPLVTLDGGPMRPGRISAEYVRQVHAAGLRYVPLKNLRHTHACLMLDAGVDLYTVSRRLGHSTTAVTELHYVDPSDR
ncbi:MAG: site-specific integrase, partial [Acidobacteriota bacterium]|nr:site-specific integrase [Acidobacteriota bacterium]